MVFTVFENNALTFLLLLLCYCINVKLVYWLSGISKYCDLPFHQNLELSKKYSIENAA